MTFATLATYTAYVASIAPTLDRVYGMYAADPTGCHATATSSGHPNNRSWLMECVAHHSFGAATIIAPDFDHYLAMLISLEVEQQLDTFSGDHFHVLFGQAVTKIIDTSSLPTEEAVHAN